MLKRVFVVINLFLLIGCSVYKSEIKTLSNGVLAGVQLKVAGGDGELANIGDTVLISYSGLYSTGEVFEQPKTENWFVVGDQRLPEGISEALTKMKKGSKASVLIPDQMMEQAKLMVPYKSDTAYLYLLRLDSVKTNPNVNFDALVQDTINLEKGVSYSIVSMGTGPVVGSDDIVDFRKSGRIGFDLWEPYTTYDFHADVTQDSYNGIPKYLKGYPVGTILRFYLAPNFSYKHLASKEHGVNYTAIVDYTITNTKTPKRVQFETYPELDSIFLDGGVVLQVIKEGHGEQPKDGQVVKVHYSGFHPDGKMFDSSVFRNEPFSFYLGGHNVIEGWEIAVRAMQKGGKYRVFIPSEKGYGKLGRQPLIAPNENLFFDIELLDF